ncbi:MAG: alpha/beta hydrolase [Proteobacteria bacterium]|nr:alpha/beta hydrolase [Pseudomonadota bacterium]
MTAVLHTPAAEPHSRLVLLPGNDLSADFYGGLARELASRGFDTRVLTLPGFDGTAPLAEPSWPAMVEAVLPVVKEGLGDDGVLVGHSLGGLLGVVLAARIRPRALVLLEPAVVPWQPVVRLSAWIYRRQVVDQDRGEVKLQGPGFKRVHAPEHFPAAVLERVVQSRSQTDVNTSRSLVQTAPELYPLPFEALTMPVLLLKGDSSGPWIGGGIRALHRRLAASVRAELQVVAEAGHWMANEQDADIAERIERFLA